MIQITSLILNAVTLLIVIGLILLFNKKLKTLKKEILFEVVPPTENESFNKIYDAISEKGYTPMSELKTGKVIFYAKKGTIIHPLGELKGIELRENKIETILAAVEELK